jgi:hypothetical protein
VVLLSMVGSVLLANGEARSRPDATPGSSGRDAAPVVERGEPFLLTESDLAAGRGVSGFTATSGAGVGGGRFPRVELAANERVNVSVSGGRAGGPLHASLGYITLTDQRLIFTGEKPLLDPLFFIPGRSRLRELSLPYASIETIRLAKRLNLGMLLGSLRPAIVIETRDGIEYVFWPNVFSLLGFIDRIEDLRNG